MHLEESGGHLRGLFVIEDDTILEECDVVLRKYAANMRDGGVKRMEFWRKRKFDLGESDASEKSFSFWSFWRTKCNSRKCFISGRRYNAVVLEKSVVLQVQMIWIRE